VTRASETFVSIHTTRRFHMAWPERLFVAVGFAYLAWALSVYVL